jgi:prevent-host-death family protein
MTMVVSELGGFPARHGRTGATFTVEGKLVNTNRISKSQFKPRALEYFRRVQESGRELIITEHGRPVLKIVPYTPNLEEALKALRGSVLKYVDPTEPVAIYDWEALE